MKKIIALIILVVMAVPAISYAVAGLGLPTEGERKHLCRAARAYADASGDLRVIADAGSSFSAAGHSYYGAAEFYDLVQTYGGNTVYYVLKTECSKRKK